MVLKGIPILEQECIGDSLISINNAFLMLDSKINKLSAESVQINTINSKNVNLSYNSATRLLSSTLSISGSEAGQMLTYDGTTWINARQFPEWKYFNEQVGTGWKHYCSALVDVVRNNDIIIGDRTTIPAGTYPGLSAFNGSVLLPDGRVFCVPHNNTTALIYNPATNLMFEPNGTYPGDKSFVGGVLMSNGKVFCVPHNSTNAIIYDPITNTTSVPLEIIQEEEHMQGEFFCQMVMCFAFRTIAQNTEFIVPNRIISMCQIIVFLGWGDLVEEFFFQTATFFVFHITAQQLEYTIFIPIRSQFLQEIIME